MNKGMYIVGGAVRDQHLGIVPKDYDIVVIGYSMHSFREEYPDAKHVGNQFPVFLLNGEEYALARTEQKVEEGHKGFNVKFNENTTIEEDLMRRDLTINAGARCIETNELICHGMFKHDIKHKVIRHCSEVFREDPLRVYRVARFASKFPDFSVAPETIELMRFMKNELRSLPVERVTAEMEKAMGTDTPDQFFRVLQQAGVLGVHFPELEALIGVPAGPKEYHPEADTFEHTMIVLRKSPGFRLGVTALCHDYGKTMTPIAEWPTHRGHEKHSLQIATTFCERMKIPNKVRKLVYAYAEDHMRFHKLFRMRPGKAGALIHKLNNIFPSFVKVAEADGFDEVYKAYKAWMAVVKVRLPERFRNAPVETKKAVLTQMRGECLK